MSNDTDLQLNEKVACIILAGGKGTRLHPLTLHRCKPDVCFGGSYRLIDVPISNALNAQIHRIFVISQHFTCALQKHLAATYPHQDLQRGNLEMLCPQETEKGVQWFEGTADAVRKNIEYLKKHPVEYFLILSGDQLYNLDLLSMVSFAKTKKADLVIATIPVKEKEAKRMGLLQIDKEGKILDFFEKPQDPQDLERFCVDGDTYLGSMGIYVFRKEELIRLLEHPGNDFGKDLIPYKIREKNSYSFLYRGYWEDIGTIDSYYKANMALTQQENCLDMRDLWNPVYTIPHHLPNPLIKSGKIYSSIISQGSLIEAEEVSNSLIGIRSIIGKGSRILNSILIGNHDPNITHNRSIGQDCLIENCIIDEDVSIGNKVRLINKNKLSHYDSEGVFIRDNIIVVASGARIPDGFTL